MHGPWVTVGHRLSHPTTTQAGAHPGGIASNFRTNQRVKRRIEFKWAVLNPSPQASIKAIFNAFKTTTHITAHPRTPTARRRAPQSRPQSWSPLPRHSLLTSPVGSLTRGPSRSACSTKFEFAWYLYRVLRTFSSAMARENQCTTGAAQEENCEVTPTPMACRLAKWLAIVKGAPHALLMGYAVACYQNA